MIAGAKMQVLVGAGVVLACLALMAWLGVRAAEATHCFNQVTGVQTTSFTGKSVTISWTDISGRCHSSHEWRGYKVEHKISSDSNWGSSTNVTTTSATVSGLYYNTSYDFRVTGRWYSDEGGAYWNDVWSDTHSQTTDTGPPGKISLLTSIARTDDSISLSWSAAPTNGASISDYDLNYKTDGDAAWLDWAIGNVRTATITGLTINQRYNFRVKADNSKGGGPWSSTYSFSTNSVPSQINPLASSSQTGFTITLTWSAPSSDDTITDYDVRYRRTGDEDWTEYSQPLSTTSLEIGGLFGNESYEFEVRATNRIGTGPWSPTFTQSTKAVPEQVAGLILTSGDKTRLSILWKQPPSTESITSYDVDYRKNTGSSDATWTRSTTSAAVVSLTIGDTTSLTAGASYEIRVRAVSSEGDGVWSETLFAETKPDLFANAAPDDFVLKELPSTAPYIVISLSWSELDESESYEVQREIDSVVSVYTTTDLFLENTYDNTADEHGQLVYRVRAKRTVDGNDNFSPWSPAVTLLFYGSGNVAGVEVLQAEIEGRRVIDPDVQEVRDSVEGAIVQVTATSGLTVNTGAMMNLLAVMPGMLMFGTAFLTGWRYRQTALGFGLGYVLLTISLFIGASLLGFPIIWPILLTVFAFLMGGIGMGKVFGWL